MEWKSARGFKAGSGWGIGFAPDASDHFFCAWKQRPLCIEICEELWYNFDIGRVQ